MLKKIQGVFEKYSRYISKMFTIYLKNAYCTGNNKKENVKKRKIKGEENHTWNRTRMFFFF